MSDRPPNSLPTEEAVISSALTNRHTVELVTSRLDASDFYKPAHGFTFAAIKQLHDAGATIDATTVAEILDRSGAVKDIGPGGAVSWLQSLQLAMPAPNAVPRYIDVIKRDAIARKVADIAFRARTAIMANEDPYVVTESLFEELGKLERVGADPERYWSDMDSYLDNAESKLPPWVITGLCYKGGRTIVLATEKAGKSVVLRQIAYCASQGVHPFRWTRIKPARVLILDCENPDREMLVTGRVIREELQRNYEWDPTRLALFSRPFGIDMRNPRHRNELETVLETFKPDLVVGGPIYKMLPAASGENDVRHADAFQQVMGKMMERHHFALILEHHAPIGSKKDGRELRSMGGQRWQAWPDVTIALAPKDGNLDVTKPHPSRGRFDWPVKLERASRGFPWVATFSGPEAPSENDEPVLEEAF